MVRFWKYIKAGLIAVSLSCLSGLSINHSSFAQSVELSEIDESQLRIVEIRLRKRSVLSSSVIAYSVQEDLLLPLSDVVYALDFPIEVDFYAAQASGWFLRETHKFNLDAKAGRVEISDTRLELPTSDIRSDGADLYVPLSLLSTWFELNATWDSQTQTVNFAPDYLLTEEEAARRARAGGSLGKRAPRLDFDKLEKITPPYKLIDWPHGRANFTINSSSAATNGTQARANLQLTGDFLKMTGEAYLNASTQGQKDARLTLSRTDASGELLSPILGKYGATQIQLGDIATTPHPLLRNSGSGLGVAISRSPLRQTGQFDTTQIEGDAVPGWQAELYRDGQLLGVLNVPESGRYIFEDIPLTFGLNRFRVELYGPSGERRTIDRPVDVSNNFIRPGDIQYRVEVAALGRGIFTNREDNTVLDFDTEDGLQATQPETLIAGQDGYVGSAEISIGLSQSVSASAGVQLHGGETIEDTQTVFASVARRGGATIISGDLAIDQRKETAARIGISTELQGVSITARHEVRSKGYDSLSAGGETSSTFKDRQSLRADGRFKPPGLTSQAGWSIGATNRTGFDGRRSIGLQGRLSGQVGGLSLNNSMNWRIEENTASERVQTANHTFNLSGSLANFRIRGSLASEIKPNLEFRQSQIEISKRYKDWFGRASYAHQFSNNTGAFGLGLSRDFNGVRLGIDVRQDFSRRETTAVMSLGVAFDRAPSGRQIRFGREARSHRGIAKVRVYEDVDLDGRYTERTDRIIEKSAVVTVPRARMISNDHLVVLDDLATNQAIGIAIDKDKLQDPYLVPASEGVSFTPRSGGTVAVDLPVVLSGEIELTLKDEFDVPREGVIAELKSCSDNQILARERAAFDGLVLFQFVKPGCYNIAAAGMGAKRINVLPGEVHRPIMEQNSIQIASTQSSTVN